MRYLDPKNDLTFKKIFGEHPHLAISLLNSLLPINDDELIESIEYLSPQLTPIIPIFKDSVVDVRCKDKKGRQFVVEMQMLWTDGFKQRVLFNSSKAYVQQMKVKQTYDLLQPVYALSFVNEVFEKETSEFYHHYSMVCNHDTQLKIEGLELIFIELPKFEPKNLVEKRLNILWLRFLKEMDGQRELAEIPADFANCPEINEAFHYLEESSFNEEELNYYNRYWDNVNREITIKQGGFTEGERYGLQLAQIEIDEAKAREKEAIAKEMVAKAREEEALAKEQEAKLQNQKAIELLLSLGMDKQSIAEKLGLNPNN